MKNRRINPVWYELDGMTRLAEYLQSMPSHELTKKVAAEISELNLATNPRKIVIGAFIILVKGFMTDLFNEIRLDLEQHFYNYPFLQMRLPFVEYASTEGRENYQMVQRFLRRVPVIRDRYVPRRLENHVIPIVLPGVDYSAESLVSSSALASESLPDKSQLGWQHLDAFADYCLGLMALGREAYGALIDAWYYGSDSDAHFKGLETIAEEMLHHVSDEIAGPRYTKRAVEREHYWMKSYGEFPEKIDIAILRLKDEYLGRLKQKLVPEALKPLHKETIGSLVA
jgi:hypothetical protein